MALDRGDERIEIGIGGKFLSGMGQEQLSSTCSIDVFKCFENVARGSGSGISAANGDNKAEIVQGGKLTKHLCRTNAIAVVGCLEIVENCERPANSRDSGQNIPSASL